MFDPKEGELQTLLKLTEYRGELKRERWFRDMSGFSLAEFTKRNRKNETLQGNLSIQASKD
jgi:hypothetical protein